MRSTKLVLAGALTLALGGPTARAVAADPGVTATEVKIGNTNPYSGPASSYGTIGKAIAAYFKMLNDEGGVNGRKINFVSLDDGYSPPKTVEMVRQLVEQEQVLFLFQTLGTPTNTAIWKYMNDQRVPHLFVATGATKWGDPKGHPWTMGWQPTYQAEGHIYAEYILKHLPNAKIGVLYQNDDYGKDYLKGFKDGLGPAGQKMIVSEQTYEVTDPTVDSQIVNLKESGADVFFNITIPKFAAQAIRRAADIGWKPTHFLKDPDDPDWRTDPGMKAWQAWMHRYYPEGNLHELFNVYGYTVAQNLVHVLRQCGPELSRANVMRQAASIKDLSLPLLLPGIKI